MLKENDRMKLPYVMYSGYENSHNFGDWWLFEIISGSMRPLKLLSLSRLIPKYRIRKLVYRGWRNDLLPSPSLALLGGGTILAPLSDDFMECLNSVKSPRFSIGSGAKSVDEWSEFNMFSNNQMNDTRKQLLRDFYEEFNALTVRGPISFQSLREIGVKKEIEIVGDPFLSIFDKNTEYRNFNGKEILLNIANLSGTQGHWWRNNTFRDEEEMYDFLITDLIRAGYSIKLITCSPEDIEICNKVAIRHSIKSVIHALTLDEIKMALFCSDAIIAVRLHLYIYALILGMPTAVLAYQDKHIDFISAIINDHNVVRLNNIPKKDLISYCKYQWELCEDNNDEIFGSINLLNSKRDKLYNRIKVTLLNH